MAIAAAIGRLLRDDELRAAMGEAGRERAEEFSWERVTAKVDAYYGLVIRRLAARGELPASFHAPIPPSSRAASAVAGSAIEAGIGAAPGVEDSLGIEGALEPGFD